MSFAQGLLLDLCSVVTLGSTQWPYMLMEIKPSITVYSFELKVQNELKNESKNIKLLKHNVKENRLSWI